MDFVIHHMCPYAERAILIKNFKNINCNIIQVDLVSKPDYLLSINPLGKVPSIRIQEQGVTYNIYESLQVCEYLDAYSEPYLYPRLPSQQINPIEKALIDMHIKKHIDGMMKILYAFRSKKPPPEIFQSFLQRIQRINDEFLAHGFFMASVLGRNQMTMADIALFPFVERFSVQAEMGKFKADNFSHIWRWFESMKEFEWVRNSMNPPHRLMNMYRQMEAGTWKGLELPLSKYDQGL